MQGCKGGKTVSFEYVNYGSSGNTHFGGSMIFFFSLSSAISSILSKEVSSINFEAASLDSILGHLSPKTHPLTQDSAQLTFCSTVNSLSTFGRFYRLDQFNIIGNGSRTKYYPGIWG